MIQLQVSSTPSFTTRHSHYLLWRNSYNNIARYSPKCFKLYQLTSVISVVQLHQWVKLLWRTVEGLQVAVRCEWTRWWWEVEGETWPSTPFAELQEKAPCCPGEWMAAAGREVTWPKTPGPEQQDDCARNSFHLRNDLGKVGESAVKKIKLYWS